MEKRRINVRAIVWRDGKILAVKHKNSDGSESDYWAVPGGGLDPSEVLQDGVRRELFEELGVESKVGDLLLVQQFPSKRSGFDEELEFLFLVEDTPAFDAINLEATSHGFHELARAEFVDPKRAEILPSILAEIDIAKFMNEPGRVVIYNDL